jgi:teichuronic acid biosynthesis glycosyltransferase TuaC
MVVAAAHTRQERVLELPSVVLITHLYPSERAPLRGVFVAEQAEALVRAGVDVRVVAAAYESSPRPSPAIGDLPVTYVRLPWIPRVGGLVNMAVVPAFYVPRVLRVLRALDSKPDLIHAHFGYPDGVVGVLLSRLTGIPLVVTLHGSDVNRQMMRPLVGNAVARILGRADVLVVVSRAMASNVSAMAPGAHVVCIPNGYNAGLFHYDPTVRRRNLLVFVGALVAVKNPLLLIEAFSDIAERTVHNLLIVGEGHDRQSLEEWVKASGLTSRIAFAGSVGRDRLPAVLQEARALVLPSRSEGLPVVLNESLACGTPVVASAVGGVPDLVTDEALGLVVPPNNRRALADAMLEATTKPWNNARIAQTAPVLDWDGYSAKLVAVYEKLISDRKSSHGRRS